MKHNAMKWIAILVMVTMLMGLGACSAGKPAQEPVSVSTAQDTAVKSDNVETEASTASEKIPVKDLGGMNIVVADWWTNNDAEEEPPANLREEELRNYRNDIFNTYNFTLKQKSICGWGDYLETFTTSVMAQNPSADIFVMGSGWAMSLLSQGLLYPLNTLDSIDLHESKWNSTVTDIFTSKGNAYVITFEKYIEPKNFLFFNKRLFSEAGIDPNEIYDLQARGEWTWDKFLEYCKKLTRDTNNDGINETYAFTGFEPEVANGFLFSNNAQSIGRGADGLFYNGMSEPNFLEAMQFAKNINNLGYWCPDPEGASWDWFVTGFHDGYAAMIMREAYSASTWADMEDDWGMVFAPKGPKASDYQTYFSENVYVLPFNISKEKAEDIMFAWNLYTNPLPYDQENPDYWKDGAYGYSRFRDTQSVDETLTMLYEGRYTPNNKDFISNVEWGPTYEWGCILGAETVAEKVEAAKPVVDAAIEETNKSFQ